MAQASHVMPDTFAVEQAKVAWDAIAESVIAVFGLSTQLQQAVKVSKVVRIRNDFIV
jgi:hypothetical protein